MIPEEEVRRETQDRRIFDSLATPACIFNSITRTVVQGNKIYSAQFGHLLKTVDELFWKSREEYDAFIHQLQTDGSVTDHETVCESRDLFISASPFSRTEVLLTISDITQWKKKERNARIQRDLGIALASCSSIKDALKLCFNAAIAVSGMECGGIYLVEKETGDFVLAHWDNLSEHFVRTVSRMPHDASYTRLILDGKALYSCFNDIQAFFNPAARQEGLCAIGLIPLCHRRQVIGTFNISSRHLKKIPESARNNLEIIASLVGNVIARIQAEEEIAKSKADMQSFFDSIRDYIFVLDEEGGILHTNQAVQECLGYTDEELHTMNVLDVHPPRRRDEALAIVTEMLDGRRDVCPIPLLKKDGGLIPVETRVTPGRWDGKKGLFGLSRDITEREKAKEQLKRHDDILQAVGLTAHSFLQNERWDEEIDRVLERLGEATGVDRIHIFQNHEADGGELLCSQRFEWCIPGVESRMDNTTLQNIPYEKAGFSRWIQELQNGRVVAGNIETFPEEERAFLCSQGIRSLVTVPIVSDSHWWGFIGFETCREERVWSQAENDALRVAADIFGAAIHQTMMNEVFKQPVEQSLLGTYLICNGTFEYVNPRFAEIFGYEVHELVHTEKIENLTHPEDWSLVIEQMQKRLSGEAESAHYEYRALTKGNEIIYIEAYGSSIEYRGKQAIVGNIMDITERKHYENELRDSLQEKVVLLNEIHHRVKNNLQIISALLRLQTMNLNGDSALQGLIDCDNRILTMALIHESLYKSENFMRIEYKSHVNSLTNNFASSDDGSGGVSYDLDIGDIILDLDTAIPCSLVITEFMILSQKDSVRGKGKRRIGIRMNKSPDSQYSLVLSDDRLCLPADIDPDSSKKFGLNLVHKLVTDQLKGTIEVRTGAGTQFEIHFPEIRG
ncbi:PAS domain S-box protein [Methanofollis fontis]|uniref:histidine kinase n=1 Tax=Methanofollis fontis TaxID=2052832 RepID=A0A483CUF4_9EURY|nr:PAS domain S-box protein [Methanofollis fontis]TAJ44938.1 hypothetical protein CUJ86_06565 [Methanofollis fontis]